MIKLMELLEEAEERTIYVDMDGVLAGFDAQFEKLFGGIPSEYEKKHGQKDFWGLIGSKGEEFWSEMDWEPGGKQLWNYVKDKNVVLLSKPSTAKTSRSGKVKWIRKHLGSPKFIFTRGVKAQYLQSKNDILIDDFMKNIKPWKAAGGIAIHHKNAGDTIKQLKKYGV